MPQTHFGNQPGYRFCAISASAPQPIVPGYFPKET